MADFEIGMKTGINLSFYLQNLKIIIWENTHYVLEFVEDIQSEQTRTET